MSLSKISIDRVTEKKLLCTDIYHPGESCFEFNFYLLKNTWIHCAKFYAPIVLLPLVKRLNSVQWTEVKNSLIFYIHMILGSYVPSILTISTTCLFSKYFGRIYLPTLIYIPNFIITMLYMPFMDARVANIYANIMLMVNIEALIREGRTKCWQILRDSKLMQTILFMVSSSIVLDTMRSMPTEIFWFLNPRMEEVCSNSELVKSPIMDRILPAKANNCKHKSSCDQYIWRDVKRSSMAMIGFETLRAISTNIKTITMTIGYALHLIVLYPSLCSNFMHRISDMVLSYRFREIRKHTFDAMFRNIERST